MRDETTWFGKTSATTPLVGLPFHPEQEINVAITERHGAGLRVSRAAAGTSQLTAAVRRVLDESSFTAGAERVQRLYAGVDRPGLAADAILRHLSEQTVRQRSHLPG